MLENCWLRVILHRAEGAFPKRGGFVTSAKNQDVTGGYSIYDRPAEVGNGSPGSNLHLEHYHHHHRDLHRWPPGVVRLLPHVPEASTSCS